MSCALQKIGLYRKHKNTIINVVIGNKNCDDNRDMPSLLRKFLDCFVFFLTHHFCISLLTSKIITGDTMSDESFLSENEMNF